MQSQWPNLRRHLPFPHYDYQTVIAETAQRRNYCYDRELIRKETQLICMSDLAGEKPLPDVFRLRYANLLFDCMLALRFKARKLYVILSGLKMEDGLFPFFNRNSWHPFFDGSVLYISDPLFSLHPDLALGWYLGTPELDPYPILAAIVEAVARKCNTNEIIAYGSSGGGFAALKLGEWLPLRVIAINPQIYPHDFYYFPEFCKKTGFCTAPDWEQRLCIVPSTKTTYLIIQNDTDKHHCEKHAYPFLKKHGIFPKYGLTGSENIYYWQYHAIGGHKYVENIHILTLILQLLENLPVTDAAELNALDHVAIAVSEMWGAIAWFDHLLGK